MPALRGHHLICLHFFDGEGYSQEFIRNLRNVLQKTGHAPVEICSGADEVCAKCPYLKDNACRYDKTAEEDIRAMDDKAMELLHLSPGGTANWHDIRNAIPGVFRQWYKSCCKDCDWIKACGRNALFKSLLADKS